MLSGIAAGSLTLNLRAGGGSWGGSDLVVDALVGIMVAMVGLGAGWLSTRSAPVRSPGGNVALVVTERRVLLYRGLRGVRRGLAADYLLRDIVAVRYRRGKGLRSSSIQFTAGGDRHSYRTTGKLDHSSLMEVLAGPVADHSTVDQRRS